MASERGRGARDLERVEGVWAVLPTDPAGSGLDAHDPRITVADLGLLPPAEEALAADGWVLLCVPDEIVEEMMASGLPPEIRRALPVYRDLGLPGEVFLAAWRLTVLLRRDSGPRQGMRRLRDEGYEVIRRFRWDSTAVSVRVPFEAGDPFDYAARLRDEGEGYVRSAAPELLQRLVPRDAYYDAQWHLHGNHPSESPCDSNAHIRAESAWPDSTGAGVRIAVIDQGFHIKHQNLDVPGKILPSSAVLSSSADPVYVGDLPSSEAVLGHDAGLFHGTLCAGLAAAKPTPAMGLSGVAPDAELMLIAIDATVSSELLADAIIYAADPSTLDPDAHPSDGADVITCSLATTPIVDPSEDAVVLAAKYAARRGRECKGCTITWAVKADSTALVSDDPIASSKYVIAVGQTNCSDAHQSDGSNAKGAGLDIVAPGRSVYGPWPDAGTGTGRAHSGTSYAAPIVAGVAALVLAVRPDLRRKRVRRVLRRGCDKVGPGAVYDPPGPRGWNESFGYGRVNAKNSVARALGLP